MINDLQNQIKNAQLPQAPDCEKGLLSSMMVSPHGVIADAIETLTEDDFVHPANRALWSQLVRMWDRQLPIDLVSVTQTAIDSGRLEEVGGVAAITACYIFVPTGANWRYYAEVLREKSLCRRGITMAHRILDACYHPELEASLEDTVQAALVEMARSAESKAETKHVSGVLDRTMDTLEALAMGGGRLEGLSTGLESLDKVTRGLQPGNLIVIAADTKRGKTALALNIASAVALAGHGVGVFSLEMNEYEVGKRLIGARAGVNMAEVTAEGSFSDGDVKSIHRAVADLRITGLYLRDESVLTPLQFRAAARKLVAQQKCRLLIVDYIQLMTHDGREQSRQEQVAAFSRTAKTTASELGIPIIILSQLNDDGRARESRSIENDANIFAIIEEEPGDKFFLNLKYSRDCPRERLPVIFRKEFTRFEEPLR